MRNICLGLLAVAVGLCTGAAGSRAACVTSDIAGLWFTQGIVGAASGTCRFTVAANGALQPAKSSCSYIDDVATNIRLTIRLRGAFSLTNAASCLFTATVTTAGGRGATVDIQAYMSRDKLVMVGSGIGTPPSNEKQAFAFTAVKN